jgi:hypothetical protein
MINNKIALFSAFTIFACSYSGLAGAAEDNPVPSITVNQIIRGEGKVGDMATSQNGEVIYVVLEGGIIEVRNTRYKTAQRYSVVKPNDNSRNN